ncbi:MAG: hypothetical protein WBA74_02420, partial [Cyclobacteriaceae bacterium]
MVIRKHTHFIIYTLILFLASSLSAAAQNTFECNDKLYQVVNGKDLKFLNPVTGQYVSIGSSSLTYNGAGFNIEDNYIYGIGSGNKLI